MGRFKILATSSIKVSVFWDNAQGDATLMEAVGILKLT